MKSKILFIIIIIFTNISISIKAQVNFAYAKSVGGTDTDEAYSVAVDAFGNVYTAGIYFVTADFDPGPGVYNMTPLGSSDVFIFKLNAAGNFLWAKSIGGTSFDILSSMTVDTLGNVYLTGGFSGVADFDPGAGTYSIAPIGTQDVFISKLDEFGNFIWAKNIGTITTSESSSSVAIDLAGNVYTTGTFNKTTDFDPGAGIYNLISGGIFVSKLDASGSFVWAKKLGDSLYTYGQSIAVDNLGNVYTAGYFGSIGDFNPGLGVFNLTPLGGSSNIFVEKMDALGNFVWAKNMGGISGTDIAEARSVAVDDGGNVYTTGFFSGTADFDPGVGVYNLSVVVPGVGITDIFISKLDSLGNFKWAKDIGGSLGNSAWSIAIDKFHNVYTTGYFRESTDFDPGPGIYSIIVPAGTGYSGAYVNKLDVLGDFVWVKELGSAQNDYGHGIAVDDTGNVYVIGGFKNYGDFDPGAGTFNLSTSSMYDADVFVVKLSNSDVWPGDANSDHVVDNTDLLPIGLSYSFTGPSRTIADNIWQADASMDWNPMETSGIDIKHADCNGDGLIDNNDTLAINSNFSLTHAFAPINNDERMLNPNLYLTTVGGAFPPGSWVNIDIMAGTSAQPVNNLYGISFDINYDASLVQPGTESLIYPNSWFANPGIDGIKVGKIDAPASTAYGAETRTNHVNADGYGKIATFRFQVKSSISSLSTMNFSIPSYMSNDSAGNSLLFNPQAFSIVIDPLATGVTNALNDDNINVYPNPNDGNFTVSFNVPLQSTYKIEVTNVLGQSVFKEMLSDFSGTYSKQLSVVDYGKGVYTISLVNDKNEVVKKIIVY